MKTVIIIDTAMLENAEQRERIEEAPGFMAAALLRQLARECEESSDLPEPQTLMLDEDNTPEVGTVVTFEKEQGEVDYEAWYYAALLGDARTYRKVHLAQEAVLAAIRQDKDCAYREGLLTSLEVLTEQLLDRANFIDGLMGKESCDDTH